MDSLIYPAFRAAGSPFRYRVLGLQNVQGAGPALYVSNHLGAVAPLEIVISVPVRFHPWIVGDMLDRRRAPAYLKKDFVRPVLNLDGRLGTALSSLIAALSVPLLRGIGSVPVESAGGWTAGAFRRSLALLTAGKNLLVFPENSKLEIDPETRMRPFNCGFAGVPRMYAKATGLELPVHPVAVHAGRKAIQIGRAVTYRDTGQWRPDTFRFCHLLQDRVRALYHGLESGEGGEGSRP